MKLKSLKHALKAIESYEPYPEDERDHEIAYSELEKVIEEVERQPTVFTHIMVENDEKRLKPWESGEGEPVS